MSELVAKLSVGERVTISLLVFMALCNAVLVSIAVLGTL